MSSSTESHPLMLKVMRLSRPNFAHNPPILSGDTSRESTKNALIEDVTKSMGFPSFIPLNSAESASNFVLSDLMVLPGNFGFLYLGETFSSYLCINNESSTNVGNVIFKAELQTATGRFVLRDTSNHPMPNLIPNQTIEFVLKHEIKTLGAHVLICNIQYNLGSEVKKLRKSYRFSVKNPLSVKTKFKQIPNSATVFLEAQLENSSSDSIFIEMVSFDPVEGYTVTDLNEVPGNGTKLQIFDKTSMLNVNDVRQYLFKIEKKDSTVIHNRGTEPKKSSVMGKLDIAWRTNMGDIGRLQTVGLGI